jgi:hypothetical protein
VTTCNLVEISQNFAGQNCYSENRGSRILRNVEVSTILHGIHSRTRTARIKFQTQWLYGRHISQNKSSCLAGIALSITRLGYTVDNQRNNVTSPSTGKYVVLCQSIQIALGAHTRSYKWPRESTSMGLKRTENEAKKFTSKQNRGGTTHVNSWLAY